jgi:hypothetical protein
MKRLARFLKKSEKAEGILAAIILIIALMMSVVIVSAVFFPFSNATQSSVTINQTDTRTGAAAYHWKNWAVTLSQIKENTNAGATLLVHALNATSGKWGKSLPYNYSAANNTIWVPGNQLWGADTKICINFYGMGYSAIGKVQNIALTVFALMAIVPLISVGGLMLRSLGFMSGGREV